MKKLFLGVFLVAIVSLPVRAQNEEDGVVPARYGYHVQVLNQQDQAARNEMNLKLESATARSRSRGPLGMAIVSTLAGVLVDKTVTFTENLLTMGVEYLSDASNSEKKAARYNTWREYVNQQNKTEQKIARDLTYNDFYSDFSDEGMYDLNNLKFNGLSCSYFIETKESILNREMSLGDGRGHDVFYIKCSLRNDDVGLAMMAEQKKFTLQVDSLAIYPDFCTIPNDGLSRKTGHFDFQKRTNLVFDLCIKFYSSWLTEFGQMVPETEIGQFHVCALVEKDKLIEKDKERVFIYSRNNPDRRAADNVAVLGSCYVVPRTYTGDGDIKYWGSGNYKLDISLKESCDMNPAEYLTPGAKKKWEKSPDHSMPDESNYKIWDKKKWEPELIAFDKAEKPVTFFTQVWTVAKDIYSGEDCIKEYMSPIGVLLKDEESKALHGLLEKLTPEGE